MTELIYRLLEHCPDLSCHALEVDDGDEQLDRLLDALTHTYHGLEELHEV